MEPFRWNGFNLEGGKEVNVKHRGTNKIPESPHKAPFGPGVLLKKGFPDESASRVFIDYTREFHYLSKYNLILILTSEINYSFHSLESN